MLFAFSTSYHPVRIVLFLEVMLGTEGLVASPDYRSADEPYGPKQPFADVFGLPQPPK